MEDLMRHKCIKCEKEEECADDFEYIYIFEAGWHPIDLGRMEYGSCMDGSDIKFEICDSCLYEWITSFKNPDLVLNTGANYYGGDYVSQNVLL
jgi:hypothetical protein